MKREAIYNNVGDMIIIGDTVEYYDGKKFHSSIVKNYNVRKGTVTLSDNTKHNVRDVKRTNY